MAKHTKDASNEDNKARWKLLKETPQTWQQDGLNSLNYSLTVTPANLYRTYTEVLVELDDG
jgi:hypothetical protein